MEPQSFGCGNGRAMVKTQKSIIIIVFIQSFLFFGLLSVYFGKDNNWDLRNYHYYNAFAFLHNRPGFDYLPSQLQTFLNPILDLPSYYLIQNTHPILAGFILGGIHGINYWIIFVLSLLLSNYTLARAPTIVKLLFALSSAGVGVYGSGFLPRLGTTTNDNLVSIFVLLSLLLIIKSAITGGATCGRKQKFCVLVSGCIMGMGIGFKLTAAIHGLGMMVALPFLYGRWKERLLTSCYWSTGMVCGFLLSAGAWMMKMWSMFGNPIFPFFNGIFKSPYMAAVNFSDRRYFPEDCLQGFLYPFYFAFTDTRVLEYPFRDIRWAIIYVLLFLLPFVMILSRHKINDRAKRSQTTADRDTSFTRIAIFMIVFFTSSYCIWQLRFSVYRYIVALELLAPIIIMILITLINRQNTFRIVLTASIFLGIIVAVQRPYSERLAWKSSFFEIEVPEIKNPENIIIIITQTNPWSYLFPHFPAAIRFVRVNTNLTTPGDKNKFQAEMEDLLEKHVGQFYLLSSTIYEIEDREIIARYGLKLACNEGAAIKSKHELPGLVLWRLERLHERAQ
ncbi:hypothetical protein L0337_19605 [candidate division KSB1 bacterium]|nr:hypothetical protein [candidate division KSB1 bacterium]